MERNKAQKLRQMRLEHARLGVLAQPPGQPHRAPLRLGVGLGERLRVGLALVGGAGGVPHARGGGVWCALGR